MHKYSLIEAYHQHSCFKNPLSPSRLSAKEILERPVHVPPNPLEIKMTEHLVRKLMVQGSGNTLTIPRQGKVSITFIYNVPISFDLSKDDALFERSWSVSGNFWC